MKKITFFFFCICFSCSLSAQTLTQIWETDTTIATPESVIFDKKQKCLFVSCINGANAPENQKGFIAKVDLNGKILQKIFTDGLVCPKGLGLLKGKLYAAAFFALVEIDAKTGQILKKYEVPEAKMLNDITVDTKKGIVYFTDMRAHRLWKLENGKVEKLHENTPLSMPNGLLYEKGNLMIGNGDGILYRYNLATKNFNKIAEGMATETRGIDGIQADGKGGYFVTEWVGKLWHVAADGQKKLLRNTVAEKINAADLTYLPKKKVLYLPTFIHNRLIAFRIM
jgi:outer membrane protein assembly factor BamB